MLLFGLAMRLVIELEAFFMIWQLRNSKINWKAEREEREAAVNLLTIKQFLIEEQQQQMDVIESELEDKTMLVDTMLQGSVDARQQKQFLEGVVLQADGVIGEMEGMLEQKDGLIGKMSETLANEKQRLRRMGQGS